MSLAHANPVARQKKLETLIEESVGDVFYSLHVEGETDPVYISEVREKAAVRCADTPKLSRHLTTQ